MPSGPRTAAAGFTGQHLVERRDLRPGESPEPALRFPRAPSIDLLYYTLRMAMGALYQDV